MAKTPYFETEFIKRSFLQNVDETLFTIINYITSGSASCSGFVIFFEKLEARVPINMFFKIGCFNESDQPPLASYGS